MSTYDQIENPIFKKTCIQADKAVQKAVNASDWSDANVKKGYLNGLAFRFINAADSTPEELDDHAEYIDGRIRATIQESDYGRAAYWKAYWHGWGVAGVMIEAARVDGDGVESDQ